MSPTTILRCAALPLHAPVAMPRVGGGVPGVWDEGGYLGGLYRVLPGTHPGPIFSHIQLILASRPYLRPNEANFQLFMRFLRVGSQKQLELTQN